MNTPIAFFIFNRPETTARVFAEIARAAPRKLFVIADGARAGRPGEAELCAAARGVIERVDWECELVRNYADENMGCGRRVTTGMDWVFEQTEEAIILEDDCLPVQSFFPFCEELLAKYRADERVMTICGDNYLFGRTETPDSYFFHRLPGGWGWATWRRAWKHYDPTMKLWPELRATSWLTDLLGDARAARYWREVFDRTYADGDRLDTWDYQWVFTLWTRRGLAATAHTNLVSNIGWGAHATHTQATQSVLANIPTTEIEFPLRHPTGIFPDRKADELIFENIYLPEMLAVESSSRHWLRRKMAQILSSRQRG